MYAPMGSHELAEVRLFVDALSGRALNTTCSRKFAVPSREATYHYCLQHDLFPPPCVVVSIGIGNIWNLEDNLAQRGCTVHAFDPTIKYRAVHERHARSTPNVHFHFAGLGGSNHSCDPHGRDPSVCGDARVDPGSPPHTARRLSISPTSAHYGPLNMSSIFPLDVLLQRAGLQTSRIALLKIDCEGARRSRAFPNARARAHTHSPLLRSSYAQGCEWDALQDVRLRTPSLLSRVGGWHFAPSFARRGVHSISARFTYDGGWHFAPSFARRGRLTHGGPLFQVDQVIIELHLRDRYNLHSTRPLALAMRHLISDHRFRVFHAELNPGCGSIDHALGGSARLS